MANVLHSSLTTTDLHEPKGVAAASSDTVYVANGAGSGAWTAVDHPVFMNKHIAGLTWSNAADASNDITIATGTCRDSTNTEDMTLSAAITKRIDAAWVVGDNQGGFDTGSVSATGVYHLFLIKRTDTDVVDAVFSATLGGPTLPPNYGKFRRIGSIFRNSGVNVPCSVIETEGGGIEVFRTGAIVETASTATAATGTAITLAQFPNNSSGLEAIFAVRRASNGSTDAGIAFSPTTVSYGNISTSGLSFANIIGQDSGPDTPNYKPATFGICRATSGQVKFYTSDGANVIVTTLGWKDPRR